MVSGEKTVAGLSNVCKFLQQGAVTGVLRGVDSTGMFQVNRNNVMDVHKLPITGGQFIETRRAMSMVNRADNVPVTIMHHRAATRGSVNYENTHPFVHSDQKRLLVGVHNGSLNNFPSYVDGINFEVDSDYAYYRIFRDGTDAFKDLHGAYALVWWENDGKLRIVCNGQRDLHFAFIHKKNAMLIASEQGMLSWLAQRNNIEIDAILRPDENVLLTFDPSEDLRDFTDEKVPKPHIKAVVMGGNQGNFTRRWDPPPTKTITVGDVSSATGDPASGEGNVTLPFDATNASTFKMAVGEEVVFYPTMSASSATQLQGQVQFPSSELGKFRYIDAVLSCDNPSLYSNIKANSIDFITATIRTITTHTRDNTKVVLLLLENPELGIGKEKEEVVEQGNDDDFVVGPADRTIGPLEFSLLTKNGCSICTRDVSWASAKRGNIGWDVGSGRAICSSCAKELEAA